MELIRLVGQRDWRRLSISAVTGLIAGLSCAAIAAIVEIALRGGVPSVILGLSLAGVCLLHLITRTICMRTMLQLSEAALYELRLDLCRRIVGASQETLQTLGKHRLLAIITRDLTTLSDAYQSLILFGINIVIIAACLIYLGWLYWPLFFVVTGFLLLGSYFTDMLRRWPMRYLLSVRKLTDGLFAQFRHLIDGTRELQLNKARSTHYVETVISAQAGKIRSNQVSGMVRFSVVMTIGELIFFGMLGLILFILPTWLPMPRDVLAAAVVTLLFVSTSVSTAFQVLPSIGQAEIALGKIRELSTDLPSGLAQHHDEFPDTDDFHLALRGVQYAYETGDNRPFVVGPIDVEVRGGEVVFLVGGNGSGKSTLVMLMLGLYRAQAGEIWLNDVLMDDRNRERYRQNFSAVFADFHLFEETPGGWNDALGARAQDYLKALRIDHKVTAKDGRYSTTDLSSGQRRRLALVSAYLEDRPAYLFDEWAADQDPEFKRIFYTRLLPELKAAGKAVIVITHDDAYFNYADRLVHMSNGLIVTDAPSRQPVRASCDEP